MGSGASTPVPGQSGTPSRPITVARSLPDTGRSRNNRTRLFRPVTARSSRSGRKGKGKRLPEVAKCSLCNGTFKSPRQLPCQHTFCEDCLEKYIQDHVTAVGRSFFCPSCRAKTFQPPGGVVSGAWASSFPPDVTVLSVVDAKPGEFELCPHHPNNILAFFCEKDGDMCCQECMFNQHGGCRNVEPISVYASGENFEAFRKNIKNELTRMENHTKTVIDRATDNIGELGRQKEAVELQLSNFRMELETAMEDFESSVREKVQKVYVEEKYSLLNNSSTCKRIRETVLNYLRMYQSYEFTSTPIKRLSPLLTISKRLDELRDAIFEQQTTCHHVTLDVQFEKAAIIHPDPCNMFSLKLRKIFDPVIFEQVTESIRDHAQARNGAQTIRGTENDALAETIEDIDLKTKLTAQWLSQLDEQTAVQKKTLEEWSSEIHSQLTTQRGILEQWVTGISASLTSQRASVAEWFVDLDCQKRQRSQLLRDWTTQIKRYSDKEKQLFKTWLQELIRQDEGLQQEVRRMTRWLEGEGKRYRKAVSAWTDTLSVSQDQHKRSVQTISKGRDEQRRRYTEILANWLPQHPSRLKVASTLELSDLQ